MYMKMVIKISLLSCQFHLPFPQVATEKLSFVCAMKIMKNYLKELELLYEFNEKAYKNKFFKGFFLRVSHAVALVVFFKRNILEYFEGSSIETQHFFQYSYEFLALFIIFRGLVVDVVNQSTVLVHLMKAIHFRGNK